MKTMVDKTPRGSVRQRRRHRLLLLALLLAPMVSCQLLGLDMYPPELQSISSTLDLPALVREKTGYELSNVGEIRQLSSGSTSLLFVMCYTTSGNVVMVLDPESLAYRSHLAGGSLPFGVDAAGCFLAGNTGYSPGTSSWTPLGTPVSIPGDAVLLVSEGNPKPNVLLRASGSVFEILAAETPWPAAIPTMYYSLPISYVSSDKWHIEAASFDSSVTGILLRTEADGQTLYIAYEGSPYDLCEAIGTKILPTGSLDNSTLPSSFAFTCRSDRCWLVDGCVVHVERDNDRRIARRRLTDGSLIDTHLIDSAWKDSLYFEPTGKRWYYYDTRISELCVLRTWW
jgi:hypothetical protein